MNEHLYDKDRQRIQKEGILKSLFLGIIIASIATVITAFFLWFFGVKAGLFIAIGVFAVLTAAITPLFYFLRYRPTVKQIARRVDELGLEERVLTMTELAGDDSEIARLQRSDTLAALSSVNHMLIKIVVSVAIIVPLVLCSVLGVGMLSVSALHFAGILPSGLVTLSPDYMPGVYTVSYAVEAGGEGTVIYWTGDWSEETPVDADGERVEQGNTAKAVYAIPAENWVFVSWSDGNSDPYRQDTVVDGDIHVEAIFEPMGPDPSGLEAELNASQEGMGGEGQQGQEGSGGQSQAGGDQSQDGEPQPGDGDEGEEGETNPDGDNNGGPEGQPNDSNGASGARDLTSQQVKDGQTYYGDEFEDAYERARERLTSDSNIPDELKDFIEDYFQSIETGSSKKKN